MKLVRLREKAGRLGWIIEEKGTGFLITNCGTAKSLIELPAADFAAAEILVRRLADGWNGKEEIDVRDSDIRQEGGSEVGIPSDLRALCERGGTA